MCAALIVSPDFAFLGSGTVCLAVTVGARVTFPRLTRSRPATPQPLQASAWREFFKPRLAGIIRAARTINPDLRVLFHSDGYFEPIIGDLVEIGVDAINPLQPEYMDAASIRRRFGTRPALWGTVGRQTTFSFSTPDEIRREVKSRIDTLGRAGLVICPAYDIDEPDIPWENIAAFATELNRQNHAGQTARWIGRRAPCYRTHQECVCQE